MVERSGARGVVIRQVEILVGLGADQLSLHTEILANQYLGGGTERLYVREPFNPSGRDVLVLRITGQPEGGLEQVQDTLYRIPPDGPPTRLSREIEPLVSFGH